MMNVYYNLHNQNLAYYLTDKEFAELVNSLNKNVPYFCRRLRVAITKQSFIRADAPERTDYYNLKTGVKYSSIPPTENSEDFITEDEWFNNNKLLK